MQHKNYDSPFTIIHCVTATYLFLNLQDIIEAQMIHISKRSVVSFWISSQLDIVCTSAIKRHYTKNNNSPCFVTGFPAHQSS